MWMQWMVGLKFNFIEIVLAAFVMQYLQWNISVYYVDIYIIIIIILGV